MRALHMIHDLSQLNQLARTDYTHVVVNPGFGQAENDAIRAAMDDGDAAVRILPSVNAHSIPEWGKGNSVLELLRSVTRRHMRYADGWNKRSVNPGKTALHNFSLEVARDMADWIESTREEAGADGVYIDDLWGDEFQPWFGSLARLFDEDNPYTGGEDTLVRWIGFRDALLRFLDRDYAGLIFANTAGYYPTAATLDGITLEPSVGPSVIQMSKFWRFAQAGSSENIAWGNELNVPGVVMPGDRLV